MRRQPGPKRRPNTFAILDPDGDRRGGGAPGPEPAAWAMMLLGSGAVGAVLRSARRRGGPITA